MQIQGIGAVVTGGGSGLGEATARALAARGARVAILDLGRSKGAEVAKSIGDAAIFCEADVASEEQVTAALDRAVESFGGIQAAVNCAGIGTAGRTVDKAGKPFDLKLFELTLRVNLVGTFNVIRLAAARMTQEPAERGERARRDREHRVGRRLRGPDRPVRLLGVEGRRGRHDAADRARSRGGRDPRQHDRAGSLRDADADDAAPGSARLSGSQVPFPRRLGKPPEFAALACHIVENPMLNGETIRLDGAIRMAPK